MERLARFGYVSCGFVYTVIGILAARVGWGEPGAFADPPSAIEFIAVVPVGLFLVPAISVGLAGYALWRFVQAFADPDKQGRSIKGLVVRSGRVISAIGYSALALFAAQFSLGMARSADSGALWAVRLMNHPFGPLVALLVALVLLVIGADDLRKAATANFGERFDERRMTRGETFLAKSAGTWGFAARSLIFTFAAAYLTKAALRADPTRARGFEGTLAGMLAVPNGDFLLRFVGIGLAAYGAFMIDAGLRRRHPF